MKKIFWLLVLAVLGPDLGTPNVASAASDYWRIRIDTYGNPDHPAYWATGNDVEVYACSWGGAFHRACPYKHTIPGGMPPSGQIDILVPKAVAATLYSIQIGTSGTNLMVIDQLRVFDPAGVLVRQFGVDNMWGFCLSSDPADGVNDACDIGAAHCVLEFMVGDGTVNRQQQCTAFGGL